MSGDEDLLKTVEEIVEDGDLVEERRERIHKAVEDAARGAPRRDVDQVRVMVEVNEDYEHWAVDLVVGKMGVHMDVKQARELALRLRQAANRLERAALERGKKGGNTDGHEGVWNAKDAKGRERREKGQ